MKSSKKTITAESMAALYGYQFNRAKVMEIIHWWCNYNTDRKMNYTDIETQLSFISPAVLEILASAVYEWGKNKQS